LVVQRPPEWWVKIGDFGIAKRVLQTNDSTALNTERIGIPAFQAPEVEDLINEDQFEYTNAVDIWSLCCMAYWLLIQKALFSLSERYDWLKTLSTFL